MISYKKYLELISLEQTEDNVKNIAQQIEIISGESILNKTVSEAKDIMAKYSEIYNSLCETNIDNIPIKDSIVVEGKTYNLLKNETDLIFEQFMNLETLSKNPENILKNLPLIICILLGNQIENKLESQLNSFADKIKELDFREVLGCLRYYEEKKSLYEFLSKHYYQATQKIMMAEEKIQTSIDKSQKGMGGLIGSIISRIMTSLKRSKYYPQT